MGCRAEGAAAVISAAPPACATARHRPARNAAPPLPSRSPLGPRPTQKAMPHNAARPQGPTQGRSAWARTDGSCGLTRLVVEEAASVSTTAAGGNASLMSLAGE